MRRFLRTDDVRRDRNSVLDPRPPTSVRARDRRHERSEIFFALEEAGFACDVSVEGMLDRVSRAEADR